MSMPTARSSTTSSIWLDIMWRHFAFRLPDLEELHGDLPLQNVVLTESLSAPGDLTATLPDSLGHEHVRVGNLDVPLIEVRGTIIISQHTERELTYANIVSAPPELDPEQHIVGVTGVGFSSVMDKLPWFSQAFDGIDVDPLDMARLLVAEASAYDTSLKIETNDVRSPTRIGEPLQEIEFSTGTGEVVDFEAGPRPRLSRTRTPDMFKVFQDMAEETPHDWQERVLLPVEGDPVFRIEFGYPDTVVDAGGERQVFEFGSQIVDFGLHDLVDYASEVFVTAGNDHPNIQAHVVSSGRRRLRTVLVEEDKSLGSLRQARNRAQALMDEIDAAYNILREGGSDVSAQYISSITVKDDALPVVLGEVVEVKGFLSWGYHWQSGRIVEITRDIRQQTTKLTLQPWEVDD